MLARDHLHLSWNSEDCYHLIRKNTIGVKLNEAFITNPKELIKQGDHLSVRVPLELLKKDGRKQEIHHPVSLDHDAIVWSDQWLLIARKPKGMPSQQTLDPKRDYFQAAVTRQLAQQGQKDPYLVLHHRLDVDTSGLMLFCRKKSLNKAVGDLFSQRKIRKTYHALCLVPRDAQRQQMIQNPWQVKNYLAKTKGRPLKMHSVMSGGDPAHTSFRVLEQREDKLLIECQPHTGRTHQLRVHLAEQGLPIVGDQLYGEKAIVPLQLHAVALEFAHPVTEQLISVYDERWSPWGN